MKKLVKLVCIMLSFMCMIQTPIIYASHTANPTNWPRGPKASALTAESALVMEASTGLVLYEKKPDKKQYPASITKIMTALLVIENCSLDEIVTFSREAVYGIEAGSSHIAVEVGEKLTIEQCLYAIMLESANEVCLGVAEHIAGSISGFVDMMNARAKELGCTNTHFVNPNGLHDNKHYTTAHDMALIAQAAIANETFRTITSTKKYTIPATNKKEARSWIRNHHQMLTGFKYPKYLYEHCIGGKTGYTTKAQSTLVTFAEKDGMTLICVVLKDLGPSYAANEYTDTTKLFEYCFNEFSLHSIAEGSNSDYSSSSLFTKYSGLLNTESPLIYIDKNTNLVLPKSASLEDVKQDIVYNGETSFQEGQNIIGSITYTYKDKVVGTGNIIYETGAITQLTTNTNISANTETIPLNKSFYLDEKQIIMVIGIVIIGFGVVYYVFIIQQRRKKSNYNRQRRNNYFSNHHNYDDYE